MRAIDADALLKSGSRYIVTMHKEAILVEDIQQAPTINIPDIWIPCEERLPNKDEMVLIFTEDTDIYVAELWDTYNEMLWWINDHRLMPLSEVYFWMPLSALPQPYREGE